MSFKSAAAIDVLALVITLFGLFGDITAAFGMSSSLAQRAMHHVVFLTDRAGR